MGCPYSLAVVALCVSNSIKKAAEAARLYPSFSCSAWTLEQNLFDLVDFRKWLVVSI